jgi:hypothetical protein
MTQQQTALAQHRGDYGVDAPLVPLGLGLAGLATLLGGLLARGIGDGGRDAVRDRVALLVRGTVGGDEAR